jgi:protein transport protein HofB
MTVFSGYSPRMDEQDTLEIAARNGLPWIDLSLVDPHRIESTERGPILQLHSLVKLPLISKSNTLRHLMPNQVLAMSDQEHIDRYTVRGDDPVQLEFEDSIQDEHELTQAPLVRYSRHVLTDAIQKGASDIHISPTATGYEIFLRIDGFLVRQPSAPQQLERRLIARIKVMANLDLTESGTGQDGSLTVTDAQRHRRRFRVAILPSLHGEKAVLRLVGHALSIPPISGLGLTDQQTNEITKALNATQGLILITGPTGSGKSVTLARMLLDLAQEDRHVATVEDPIEFELSNVHQVQLNRARQLDFPKSLRALLRQDPDVLMIGKIRSQETAEIAIQASETGHLVLATLHTKRAQDVPNRLAHFGITSHAFDACVRLVISQRLIRTLCLICDGNGCSECNQGFRGRAGLFEFWRPGDPIGDARCDYYASVTHHFARRATKDKEIQRVLGHLPDPIPQTHIH